MRLSHREGSLLLEPELPDHSCEAVEVWAGNACASSREHLRKFSCGSAVNPARLAGEGPCWRGGVWRCCCPPGHLNPSGASSR